MRVVKHWHGLPGNVVDALSLGTFMVRFGGTLSNLIELGQGDFCISEAAACGRGYPGAPRSSPQDGCWLWALVQQGRGPCHCGCVTGCSGAAGA